MKPHKHAELIKAWADGAVIETWDCGHWYLNKNPDWNDDRYKHRIQKEPAPDFKVTYSVIYDVQWGSLIFGKFNEDMVNVNFTLDGETGLVKAAEVLK